MVGREELEREEVRRSASSEGGGRRRRESVSLSLTEKATTKERLRGRFPSSNSLYQTWVPRRET